MDTSRNKKLDMLRALALFFVIAIHSLNKIGYYNLPIQGLRLFALTVGRVGFRTCVPLFLMLSGYLQKSEDLNKEYLLKLSRVVISYIVIGIVCISFDFFYYDIKLNIKELVLKLLSFDAAPYAWYIEMYIGLYLLMPFCNRAYNHFTKKEKLYLLVVLFIVTSLPTGLNSYNFDAQSWWLGSNDNYSKLFMNYWVDMYPWFYYFLGKYIKEINENCDNIICNISAKKYLITTFITIVTFGTINFITNYKKNFIWNGNTSYNSIQTIIISLLIFQTVYSMSFEKMSRLFYNISEYSLGAYLVSYIYDEMLYGFIGKYYVGYNINILVVIMIVFIDYFFSILTSYFLYELIIGRVYKFIIKL